MRLLLSKYKWHSSAEISVTGFIREGNSYLYGDELIKYFADLNVEEFENRLRSANGQFAVIVKRGSEVWAATDRLRTLPLFYHFDSDNSIVGDSAYSIASEMKPVSIDENASNAFLCTGYTLNNNTLIKDLFQIEAGELVVLGNKIRRWFYFDYSKSYISTTDFKQCSSELAGILTTVFESHLHSLEDRFIAIPLSGGYDSRLIALMCKKFHQRNILCYTYGRKGNKEVTPARKTAEQLGLKWINIEYNRELIKGFIDDQVFLNYYPFASELCSMFFMQDYFAVKYLKDKSLIPENSVFMPGHSGDFLAGGHTSPYMGKWTDSSAIIRHILNENFTLKMTCKKEKKVLVNEIEQKIRQDETAMWLLYENWEIKERQAKFIVNSSSAFSYFGYEHVMPFWDNLLIDFFNKMPVNFKLNKNLYDYTLKKFFFAAENLNFDNEINPTPRQLAMQRFKKTFKRIIPGNILSGFINMASPVFYDEISKDLILDGGPENFTKPHESNNYNSYLTQWYLLKTKSFFGNNSEKKEAR